MAYPGSKEARHKLITQAFNSKRLVVTVHTRPPGVNRILLKTRSRSVKDAADTKLASRTGLLVKCRRLSRVFLRIRFTPGYVFDWRLNGNGWRLNGNDWRLNGNGWRLNSNGWRVNSKRTGRYRIDFLGYL